MTKMKKLYGFTLIELLVVIVIIGILAGIGVSSFLGAKKKAEFAAVKVFAKQSEGAFAGNSIGWWNFGEGSGLTAASRVDNSPALALTDAGQWTDESPYGLGGGKSVSFNGVNESAESQNSLSGEFQTISFWFELEEDLLPSQSITLLSLNKASASYGVFFGSTSNSIWNEMITILAPGSSSYVRFPDGKTQIDAGWHHVSLRWSESLDRYEFFFDGKHLEYVGSIPFLPASVNVFSDSDIVLGRRPGVNNYHKFKIHDLQISSDSGL